MTAIKFRAECECGDKTPRPVTAWTAAQWMRKHVDAKHEGRW